jgi:hypothetical protein
MALGGAARADPDRGAGVHAGRRGAGDKVLIQRRPGIRLGIDQIESCDYRRIAPGLIYRLRRPVELFRPDLGALWTSMEEVAFVTECSGDIGGAISKALAASAQMLSCLMQVMLAAPTRRSTPCAS